MAGATGIEPATSGFGFGFFLIPRSTGKRLKDETKVELAKEQLAAMGISDKLVKPATRAPIYIDFADIVGDWGALKNVIAAERRIPVAEVEKIAEGLKKSKPPEALQYYNPPRWQPPAPTVGTPSINTAPADNIIMNIVGAIKAGDLTVLQGLHGSGVKFSDMNLNDAVTAQKPSLPVISYIASLPEVTSPDWVTRCIKDPKIKEVIEAAKAAKRGHSK